MVENPYNTHGSSSVHLGSQIIKDYTKEPLGNDFLSGEVRHYRDVNNSALILAADNNYRFAKITQVMTTVFGSLGTSEVFNNGLFNYKASVTLGVAAYALLGLLSSDMRNRAITIVKALRKS